MFNHTRFAWIILQRIYLAPLLTSEPPVYSEKPCSVEHLGHQLQRLKRRQCPRHAHLRKFVLEYINLIWEKDDWCRQEPPGVDDRLKKNERLCHSVLRSYQSERQRLENDLRTWLFSSRRTWSYSDNAVQRIILIPLSKLCILFLRSDRCPPTSTICIDNWPKGNRVSAIAVIFARANGLTGWRRP